RRIWPRVGPPPRPPAPLAPSVVPHRAVPAGAQVAGPAGIEIPEDALVPEPGTGLLQPGGKGKTARARVTYRLWGSAAHDNTRVTPADALYPYSFAARWGTRRAGAGDYDPAVDAATAVSRQALAAVRLVGVESEVRRYSDITFTYVIPVIEVYLKTGSTDPQELAGLGPPWGPGARAVTYVIPVIEVYLKTGSTDPQELAALAPPWSTVPWHVTALMEEAVRRGVGAFSSAEAKRRGGRVLRPAPGGRTRDD